MKDLQNISDGVGLSRGRWFDMYMFQAVRNNGEHNSFWRYP